jgi:hypothetical protein
MFTGRIHEIGEIASVVDERIVVHAPKTASQL